MSSYSCIENANATSAQQGQCSVGFEQRDGAAFFLISPDLPPASVMSASVAFGFMIRFGLPRVISAAIKGVVKMIEG